MRAIQYRPAPALPGMGVPSDERAFQVPHLCPEGEREPVTCYSVPRDRTTVTRRRVDGGDTRMPSTAGGSRRDTLARGDQPLHREAVVARRGERPLVRLASECSRAGQNPQVVPVR